MAMKQTQTKTKKAPSQKQLLKARMRRRRAIRRTALRGGLVAVAALAVVGIAWLGSRPKAPKTEHVGAAAPAFNLPSTDGRQISLESLRGKKVLIYFNEGVGCDACFSQMVDLERQSSLLERAGVTVVPITINPMEDVRKEVARFDLRIPWLVDKSKSVSDAYGVLGKGMHAGLPGHSFVLVDEQGILRWHQDYPSMFVETKQLLSEAGLST